ncbi:MAG: error-prone DNA polymerase [Proteobacteria bacterium]|nr:MAG: error-prone DNA polymerase [Pseudomonadota bacterium]
MAGSARSSGSSATQGHAIQDYAELHCLTNFTFLRGASHPEELVEQAIRLGYKALAITDECSVSGVVRAHCAARNTRLKVIVGTEITLSDAPVKLVLLATNRAGYGELCQFITTARRRAEKGGYDARLTDLTKETLPHCLALWMPGHTLQQIQHTTNSQEIVSVSSQIERLFQYGKHLQRHFSHRIWVTIERILEGHEARTLPLITLLAQKLSLPLTAAGDVHMHIARRKKLQDTLTAIRLGLTIQEAGFHLPSNHERYLRPRRKLQRLYPLKWLSETLAIADRCTFSLNELRYEYPGELVPPGLSAIEYLQQLVNQGISRRFPDGLSLSLRHLIDKELSLIKELSYAHYFLTIQDIVRFAKSRQILCQGRGSAANSIVCYCLGITEVDPTQISLLFERFISRERNEPPDIDVDFEHERREEVIQYIYGKYGRHRSAITATVITYRGKSALRDVGKALGIDSNHIETLLGNIDWRDKGTSWMEQLKNSGINDNSFTGQQLFEMAEQILGFPRHLSQHVGGFVISSGPMSQLVPIENAGMADRTVIQWDKDDLETLGLLKVDILGLGMLSAIRKTLDMIRQYKRFPKALNEIPKEDPAVYRMLQKGDSVGVFQVESRAQTGMLPRLKPASYYDLVVQVAIVRPGPIQGDMVHPYLRRRNGLEPVHYPNKAVEAVLKRTLGVPIFQEQVIKLAMVAAGFSAGEADQLRRAMASWKHNGKLKPFQDKLIAGMTERGHSAEFARRICRQISGFGEYGFPESHAASFALLVYTSAWLKYHEPAAFYCGLLNSLPMGFYSASQLIQDARYHGITLLGVDINHSHWHHQPAFGDDSGQPAIRLGFRIVKQLPKHTITNVIRFRPALGYQTIAELGKVASLHPHELEILAGAGALSGLSQHRYQARWDILAIEPERPVFDSEQSIQEESPRRYMPFSPGQFQPEHPTEAEDMQEDYLSLGLSVDKHPLDLLRRKHNHSRGLHWLNNCKTARELPAMHHGSLVSVAGLVTGRQRPGSGSGVTFVTLEDETGNCNIIVWLSTARAQRKALINSVLLQVTGILEREGDVIHIIAGRLTDRTQDLEQLCPNVPVRIKSRDFH